MGVPVGYTCPKIDKALQIIEDLQHESIIVQRNYDIDVMDGFIDSCYSDLNDIVHILEELRNDNSALREFGEQQEQLANEYLQELNPIKAKGE